MPLRFDLAPGEKLYIGTSIFINGKTRIDFVLDGSGPVMKERDYIDPEACRNDLERLYCCVQRMYLENKIADLSAKYLQLMSSACEARRLQSEDVALVNNCVASEKLYVALRHLKKLINAQPSSAAA